MAASAADSGTSRLGGFDRTILATERVGRRVCADCVWLLRYPGDPPTLAQLRERVATRLGALPWLSSRLSPAVLGLGLPRMVPDPDFDLAEAVRELPEGFEGEWAWLDFVALELEESLAGRRPLWSLYLAPGEGCFGVILRIHHFLADGQSGFLILRTLLGDNAATALPAGPVAATTTGPLAPRRLPATAATLTRSLVRWLRGPRPPRLRRLNRTLGPRRRLAYLALPIDDVEAIGRRTGAFPNEIYLALVAGALRRFLAGGGVDVDGLADLQVGTMVDVGGRRDGRRLGNHYAAVRVPLNVREPDPRVRFAAIRRALAELRAGTDAEESVTLVEAMAPAPAPLVRLVAWIITSPRMTLNTIASHLAGNRGLAFRGVEPTRLCSWTYQPAGQSLSFVCQLSPTEMTINVMVDPDAVGDPEAVVAELGAAAAELTAALGVHPPERASTGREHDSVQNHETNWSGR